MPIISFTPNTVIKSADMNANNTNFSNHDRWITLQWLFTGSLVTQNSSDWKDLPDAVTWSRCDISVGTAPTGAAIIVDIQRSTDSGSTWVTIFTGGTNRPQIAASALTGSTTTIDIPAGVANSHLYRAVISQIGSTVAGSDLSIRLKGKYNYD